MCSKQWISLSQVSVTMGCAARERNVVFASTLASFFTRAYDQLRMAAISESNINVCGSHCGLSTGILAAHNNPCHAPYPVKPSLKSLYSLTVKPDIFTLPLMLTRSDLCVCVCWCYNPFFPSNPMFSWPPFSLTASPHSPPFPLFLSVLEAVSREAGVPLLVQVYCMQSLAFCLWNCMHQLTWPHNNY